MHSSRATSSVSVEFLVLIFRFVDELISPPPPSEAIAPVWPRISADVCHANYLSTISIAGFGLLQELKPCQKILASNALVVANFSNSQCLVPALELSRMPLSSGCLVWHICLKIGNVQQMCGTSVLYSHLISVRLVSLQTNGQLPVSRQPISCHHHCHKNLLLLLVHHSDYT